MCNIYGSFRCYCPFHISSIISFVHTSNALTETHHHHTAYDSTNKKFYAWFFHLRWTVSISTPRNELEDRWSCHTDFINLLIANRALCELIHKRIPIAVQKCRKFATLDDEQADWSHFHDALTIYLKNKIGVKLYTQKKYEFYFSHILDTLKWLNETIFFLINQEHFVAL